MRASNRMAQQVTTPMPIPMPTQDTHPHTPLYSTYTHTCTHTHTKATYLPGLLGIHHPVHSLRLHCPPAQAHQTTTRQTQTTVIEAEARSNKVHRTAIPRALHYTRMNGLQLALVHERIGVLHSTNKHHQRSKVLTCMGKEGRELYSEWTRLRPSIVVRAPHVTNGRGKAQVHI